MRIALRTLLPLLALLVSACQALPAARQPGLAGMSGRSGGEPAQVSATPSATATIPASVVPAATFTSLPAQTIPAAATASPTAPFVHYQVRWHPDGPVYVGDKLSLEVISSPAENLKGKTLQIHLVTKQGNQSLGSSNFEAFGLGNRLQATFWWFWDTAGLEPGVYSLKFTLLPEASTWQETVTLLPASALPEIEARAEWLTAESQCCEVYYIRGTAAERDLDSLLAMLDGQAASIEERLEVLASEKIPIVLLPRVLGHGGFSSDSISVSYLDRNYAGSGSELVLHHELVHWLDAKLGGELRPSLLIEGLAVYLTGGHFKPEPVLLRAAALLPPTEGCLVSTPGAELAPQDTVCGLDRYIPLKKLADDFYPSQHETGYLEAGALIEFMVERWGWQAFNDFYRDIHPAEQPTENETGEVTQSTALETALQKHFGIDLETLENSFIATLRQVNLTPELVDDVRLSIDYYDALRQYQQLLDPSAYFLFAWLADSETMRKEGITADYLRHPVQPENIALELMFITADDAIRANNAGLAAQTLAAIHEVLEKIARGEKSALAANPLTEDYANLVQAVQRAGYQPQRAELTEDEARVWASANKPDLTLLQFVRSLQGWQIQETMNAFLWELPYQAAGLRANIQPVEQ